MKHLQSYNNFNKVNEELSPSEIRSIRFIPKERNKVTQIELKQVSIVFKRIK
jgi:hypothetical protein